LRNSGRYQRASPRLVVFSLDELVSSVEVTTEKVGSAVISDAASDCSFDNRSMFCSGGPKRVSRV
jgi:hypothetical protein